VLWIAGGLLAVAGVLAAGGIFSGPTMLASSSIAAGLAVAALAMPDGLNPILVVRRKRNRERLAAVRAAAQRLRDAASIRSVNELLAAVAPRLDARAIQLREATQLVPVNGVECADECLAQTSVCLNPGRPDSETLEVVWSESRRPERDAEIALELLGRHVATSLRRIRERPTMLPWRGSLRRDGPTRDRTTNILGYEITPAGKDDCVRSVVDWIEQGDRCKWLACINPHSYVVAKSDRDFAAALQSADWLIPDGAGIVLASRLLRQSVRQRVTGSDIFAGVNEELQRRGGSSVFFLGSTEETSLLIRERMRHDYPSVRVVGFHSPPFKASFSASEMDEMIARINAVRPDVLWVGMTAPKQERWLHQNSDRLNVKFAAAIGAVFDFYSGRVQRPSPVMQRLGLEWLPRLLREPRRLWRRSFVSAPMFLWDVFTHVASSDRPAAEPSQPLLLTSPRMERVEERASSRTGTATAAVGTSSAQGSQEAHP
jgi:N-acetylglucosaminyldiphosphoundecaprenol N-acetyl-beta-D-mannosaminyltransferase